MNIPRYKTSHSQHIFVNRKPEQFIPFGVNYVNTPKNKTKTYSLHRRKRSRGRQWTAQLKLGQETDRLYCPAETRHSQLESCPFDEHNDNDDDNDDNLINPTINEPLSDLNKL